MVFMLKAFECANKIEFVSIFLAETRQNGHFDLALSCVRWMIFQDLYSNDIVSSTFPAFYHLAKCTAAQELQHLNWQSIWKRTGNELLCNNLLLIPYIILYSKLDSSIFSSFVLSDKFMLILFIHSGFPLEGNRKLWWRRFNLFYFVLFREEMRDA